MPKYQAFIRPTQRSFQKFGPPRSARSMPRGVWRKSRSSMRPTSPKAHHARGQPQKNKSKAKKKPKTELKKTKPTHQKNIKNGLKNGLSEYTEEERFNRGY